MRAVSYQEFGGPIAITDVPEPTCPADGVVLQVGATGLCRSDWHAWRGHDPDVVLPHVPGHELAGVVAAVGPRVQRIKVGQRVTVPFVCACGRCPTCRTGDGQVCEHQQQPGFTHWGSFAEFVALHRADVNVVPLPDSLALGEAALLGCRFSTAYRAVTVHAALRPEQWLAVHGCGGVGLAAVMIAAARGIRVVAIDPSESARRFALSIGAAAGMDPAGDDMVRAILDLTKGGVHASIDAVGLPAIWRTSIASLRHRGRHVQIGLMAPEHSTQELPVTALIAKELTVLGSHGMAADDFAAMISDNAERSLDVERLITRRIALSEAPAALEAMDGAPEPGVTVIEPQR